jgi:hypothetical protein
MICLLNWKRRFQSWLSRYIHKLYVLCRFIVLFRYVSSFRFSRLLFVRFLLFLCFFVVCSSHPPDEPDVPIHCRKRQIPSRRPFENRNAEE